MKLPFLSIIIPVFNEEKRLYKTFEQLTQFIKTQKSAIEIIFVDDGSSDKSKLKIKNSKLKVKTISYQPNHGKGYAVKQGVLKAKGKWILVVDADMSIPLTTLKRFKPYLKPPYVMIVGNRDESSRKQAHQTFMRRFLSGGFRILSKMLTGVTATDITCGFKCFESNTGKKLFGQLTINRWAYDTQIFYLAKKYGITPTPVAIEWQEDTQTRVNMLPAMMGSMVDLLKIKFNL